MLSVDAAATTADASQLLNAIVMLNAMFRRGSTMAANVMKTSAANVTKTVSEMLIANVTNYAMAIRVSVYRVETRSRRTDDSNFETTKLIELRLLSRCNIGVNFSNGCGHFSSYCRRNVNDAR